MNPALDSGIARPSARERLALNTGCVAVVAALAALASVVLVAGRLRPPRPRPYAKAALLSATPCPPRRLASARSARVSPPMA